MASQALKAGNPNTSNAHSHRLRVVMPDTMPCRPSISQVVNAVPSERYGRRPPPMLDHSVIGVLFDAACRATCVREKPVAMRRYLTQARLCRTGTSDHNELRVSASSRERRSDPQRKRDGLVAGNKGLRLLQRF